jgi:hypothetical protein
MGKGYAEGSAVEERLAALERGDAQDVRHARQRPAVFAATVAEPEQHFIGWLDDVDPDALFAAGEAWGIKVVQLAEATEAASAGS